MIVPCAVGRAVRPAAKLAHDTGQGSQCKEIGTIPSEGLMLSDKCNKEPV